MKLIQFIVIISFMFLSFDVRAQVPQGLSSMPEQWQLTLDVIKSKVQTLVIENNRLQAQYRKLTDQAQKLQQSIDDQQNKNEQMDFFLKKRHGATDQQVRIEELTKMIKTKSQETRTFDKQLKNLQRKKPARIRKIEPQDDDQLAQLRKQLDYESTQEVLLENELAALKTAAKTQ